MAEIKGGITVSGGSVDSMPVILDGRKSLYEEAIEQGLIDKDESYEQFINLLAVKPSELDKVVKSAVAENLEKTVNTAVAAAIGMLDLNKPITPTDSQPAGDISDATLAEIKKHRPRDRCRSKRCGCRQKAGRISCRSCHYRY